jgi:uncharacterized delta-60 repeat protein
VPNKSLSNMRFPLLAFAVVSFFTITALSDLLLASAGDLDPSFDFDGKTTADFGADDLGLALAVQADGKVLLAGYTGLGIGTGTSDFALIRLNMDGSLDSTFDGDGKVTTDFAGADDLAYAVAIQSDGKIIVAGSSHPNLGTTDFALARYNPDGSLDSSFDGDGKLITDFLGDGDSASGIAIQPDGKIIASGWAYSGSSTDFALCRYNSDGTLDSNFGLGGKVTTDFNAAGDQAWAVVLQPDGKIVLAGEAYTGSGVDFALARYNNDGSLDLTFGGDGKVITQFASNNDGAQAVALQPDGKIIAAGVTNSFDYALARYDPDGSLDSTFDGDGKVITDFAGHDDGAYAVAVQPDGKIIAAGDSSSDFGLARYNSDGSLDLSFNLDGKVTTDFGSGGDVDLALALQPDGKIIAAGYTNTGSDYNFALARYLGDPCLYFCDDFGDGVLAPDWTYVKPQWMETGGNLVGTPTGRKAEAIASPAFSGCTVCTVEATITTAGGIGNKIWLLAWYVDKQNTIEVLMKEENDRWILKQRSNGSLVAKAKGIATILPNKSYDVKVSFDGTSFSLSVDGFTVATMLAFTSPNGTVGFRVKNTIGTFGFITVN